VAVHGPRARARDERNLRGFFPHRFIARGDRGLASSVWNWSRDREISQSSIRRIRAISLLSQKAQDRSALITRAEFARIFPAPLYRPRRSRPRELRSELESRSRDLAKLDPSDPRNLSVLSQETEDRDALITSRAAFDPETPVGTLSRFASRLIAENTIAIGSYNVATSSATALI